MAEKKSKSKWPLYLSVGLVVGVVLLYFTVPAVEEFTDEAIEVLSSGEEEEVSAWVDQFGWAGPLALILAMTLQMAVLVVPTVLVMVVSIMAYGPFFGSGIILAGIFIASSIAYGLGKSLGSPLIENFLGSKTKEKMKDALERYGFWAVIVFRFSPFLSNDAISLVAGIMKMGYWKFIGATMLGILPLTILIAIFGEQDEGMQTGLIWLGGISLAGFVAYVWWDWKREKNQ